jgi:hypothetical protein
VQSSILRKELIKMIHFVSLGTSPALEECVEISSSFPYLTEMLREARMFRKQLVEQFQQSLEPNMYFGIRRTKSTYGDFVFVNVAIYLNEHGEVENETTLNILESLPEYWDVGYHYHAKVSEYIDDTNKDRFMEVFKSCNKIIMVAKIYTKEIHIDALIDPKVFNSVVVDLIDNKKTNEFIEYLNSVSGNVIYTVRNIDINNRILNESIIKEDINE